MPVTFPLQLGVQSEAVFDAVRKNRFVLRRIWDRSKPMAGFCMTNPSKAGQDVDDPTVRKDQMYARLWGYGGIVVVNAFSWCSTDPRGLRSREEPPAVVESNFRYIVEAAEKCGIFICAWGLHATLDQRNVFLLQALRGFNLHCLRLTKDGHPEHPLYLPMKLKPVPFSNEVPPPPQ